ncbi:MAG: glycosyltransferase family 9 protein [candidate division KSB1 bacterium]|nr:glycosyltransferase family 9 protein [candidate division KSB1 bacterium]
MPRRVLLIKLRAIGDVVLATPALAEARKAFPTAQIDFLTEPPSRQVLEGNPHVDHVLLHDRRAPFLERVRLLAHIRRHHYDLVVDLFGNPRSALITFLSRSPVRVGFDFRGRRAAYTVRVPPRGHLVHEVEFNLDALRALGVYPERPRLEFPVPESAREYIAGFLQRNGLGNRVLVGLNNSGGWPAKRWLPERAAELARWLVGTMGVSVVVLWGPGEEAAAREVVAQAGPGVFLAPPTDLKQLGALLGRIRLLVTTDSAPMHIAAAVGTKVVALFGPTNPALQGPFGPGHVVVRNESVACLGCNRTTCSDGRCMSELSVEKVAAACEQALAMAKDR